MPNLRIGIDVGGTFTHGVILRPPGEVVASARTPTTHGGERGVATGVATVLRELLTHCGPADIALVAHSTTQATNALLEGDLSPVILAAIVPPGEGLAVRNALPPGSLDIGGGHSVDVDVRLILWEEISRGAADSVPPREESQAGLAAPPEYEPGSGGFRATAEDTAPRAGTNPGPHGPPTPVAVVQPLAGNHPLREHAVADHFRQPGHPVVCASDITQVLGLAARARTAIVNAAMLPKMVATAEYTARAVEELLPGVPVQVVRSDGGAMSLAEMRRMPVLSLLSGPAAGASAALARTGLSNVVFIEVGGTSTDITLIKDGRVRHRHATVGGQRLMVPALDLRTVAVGGGSMLRADGKLLGPRSAHIVPLPYLFGATSVSGKVVAVKPWQDLQGRYEYLVARTEDGGHAAITATDVWLATEEARTVVEGASFSAEVDLQRYYDALGPELLRQLREEYAPALRNTARVAATAATDLLRSHQLSASACRLVAGGGGAHVHGAATAELLGMEHSVVDDHAVISAIGAALAVTCVSLSKSVAEPTASDIAELTRAVGERLSQQGAQRVSTDYEFDSQRQVLTVTGRGNQPYLSDARIRSHDELQVVSNRLVSGISTLSWGSSELTLWSRVDGETDRSTPRENDNLFKRLTALFQKPAPGTEYVLLDQYGRCLWQGRAAGVWPVKGAERETVLSQLVDNHTQYTDGGPLLPGLAFACAGRLIPLDQLGSAQLILEVLRWEQLPAEAAGCFILRG